MMVRNDGFLLGTDVILYLLCFKQVVLISATLPHEILEMTSKFMTEPVRILVKRDELTLEVNTIESNALTNFDVVLATKFEYPVFRASNNSLLLLRKRNGSLIRFVIFMIHSRSPKLLFSAILRER